MKITTTSFKDAVTLLETGLIDQEPVEINKVALAIGFRRRNGRIFDAIASGLAEGGLVDVDELRADIEAGLKAGSGRIRLPVKIPQAVREFLGVTLENVTLTKENSDYFFDKIIPTVAQTSV